MNIIKRGVVYPYKGTCVLCGSILECTIAEVRTTRIKRTDPVMYKELADCPVCLEKGEKTSVVFREK